MALIRRASLPAAVTVYKDSSTFYAHHRDDGTLDSGSNAQTVLQSAFNATGKIYVCDATYPTTSALTVPSNTEVVFESWNAVIEGAGSHVLIKNSDTTNGNSSIKISGGAFDGNNGSAQDGSITFDKVTNLTVEGCKVIDSPSEGIKARGGTYTHINNNYINKTATVEGSGRAGIIAATNAGFTSIINNHCVDCGGEGIGAYNNSGYTNIVGNTSRIVNSGRGHILVEGTTDGSLEAEMVNIVANTVLSDYYGIHILTGIGFNVSNNTIRHFSSSSALDGIRIAGASKYGTVTANTIINPAQHGISLLDSARQVVVNGNTIISPGQKLTNTYHGILVAPAGGFVREPTLTNNIIVDDQGTPTMSVGISLQAGAQEITNLVCTGNTIRGVNSQTIGTSGTISGIIRNNNGHVTENSGTGTIANGATNSGLINHGLSYTPSAADFDIQFTEIPTNDIGSYAITNISSTQFRVDVKADPGASGLDFSWGVRRIAI